MKSSLKKLINHISLECKYRTNRGLVLLYHRVADIEEDSADLAVSLENFKKQLRHLKENYHVLSPDDFIKQMRRKQLKKKSVLLTFDDGYVDFYKNAFPIIQEVGVPVAIFVSTGNIDSQKLFWWDEVELLVKEIAKKQNYLTIEWEDISFSEYFLTRNAVEKIIFRIVLSLKKRRHSQRLAFLQYLKQYRGNSYEVHDFLRRTMSSNELLEIASSPLITIGAHTVSHLVLSSELPIVQREEIDASKKQLEALLGRKIKYFAYPFGTKEDYSSETLDICKTLGFEAVFSNYFDLIRKGDFSPFDIPRGVVKNWSLNEFKEKLDSFWGNDRLYLSGKVKAFFLQNFNSTKENYFNKKLELTVPDVSKVSMINTSDGAGGAARLAVDLGKELKTRFDLTLYVSKKSSSYKWVSEVDSSHINNKKLVEVLAFKGGILDQGLPWGYHLAKNKIFQRSKFLILHNLHGGYFDINSLRSLGVNKKIFWVMHDMSAITGHCAHSFDCEGWKLECNKCNHLNYYPSIGRDRAGEYLRQKKEIIDSLDIEFVVPSEWLRNKLASSIFRFKKNHLIYNGVDSKFFKPVCKRRLRRKWGIKIDTKIILFCANGGIENQYKGGDIARLVYQTLSKQVQELKLFIIGGYEKKSSDGEVEIGYVDSLDEMNELYNLSDVLFYPSRADNCPLVVLEAKMAGLPIVASRTGGLPELINDEIDGFLFNIDNVSDAACKIKNLLFDEEKTRVFSESARRDALDRFSLEVMGSKYKDLIEKSKV